MKDIKGFGVHSIPSHRKPRHKGELLFVTVEYIPTNLDIFMFTPSTQRQHASSPLTFPYAYLRHPQLNLSLLPLPSHLPPLLHLQQGLPLLLTHQL
jgi:hypothetical protein